MAYLWCTLVLLALLLTCHCSQGTDFSFEPVQIFRHTLPSGLQAVHGSDDDGNCGYRIYQLNGLSVCDDPNAAENVWHIQRAFPSMARTLSFDGNGYLQPTMFGRSTNYGGGGNVQFNLFMRPNDEEDALVMYAYDTEESFSMEVAFLGGRRHIILKRHDLDPPLYFVNQSDDTIDAEGDWEVIILYSPAARAFSINGDIIFTDGMGRFFINLTRTKVWFGGVREDMLEGSYIPEVTNGNYYGCIDFFFPNPTPLDPLDDPFFSINYLNSPTQRGFSATCLTTMSSWLVDGIIPTLDFSDDNWAEGFFTVSRNDRTTIVLGFELDTNDIITRVELESLEYPDRGIGTSSVSLFGMEGGSLFPRFSGTTMLLDTVTPEAMSCSVQTHTLCIPMGVRSYRYYYLEFTFSNSDINWLFLAEVRFLVNSPTPATTSVLISTTTTVTPPTSTSRSIEPTVTPITTGVPLLFQLRLPMEHCTTWSLEKVQAVTGDILKETTNAISKYCNCSFPAGSIASGKLSCRNSPSYVTYRSMIGYGHGHSIEEVLTFIENWVSTSPTIVAGPYIVDIDPSCTIRISSLTDPECPPPEIRTLEDEVLITRNPTAISCINKCGSRSGLVSLTCRD